MPDDDYLFSTIDCLCHAALTDSRLAPDAQLRRRMIDVAERVAALSGITISADHHEGIAILKSTTQLRALSNNAPIAYAYARANPWMSALKEIRDRVDPDLKDHWYVNARHAARRKYLLPVHRADTHNKKRVSVRTGHGRCEPIHPISGAYYSETADETKRPDALVLQHRKSPWYLFHAWAWGRRVYADWLRDNNWDVCPFTAETQSTLRKGNPDDGSGLVWLDLARDYLIRLREERTTTLALPMPYYYFPAHLMPPPEHDPDWPFYQPTRAGSTLPLIMRELNIERAKHGLKLASFDRAPRIEMAKAPPAQSAPQSSALPHSKPMPLKPDGSPDFDALLGGLPAPKPRED